MNLKEINQAQIERIREALSNFVAKDEADQAGGYLYPHDPKQTSVTLPPKAKAEVLGLLAVGKKVEAIAHVQRLTGAGLKLSKDYVDSL